MSSVHAPYGFVPLSEHVFLPEWQGAVSQDLPFEDGLSGTIDLRLIAETPIFVRGSNKDEFFRTPDAVYAIPGSSIRGAIRNIIEIATFGWMSRFNDHRYGVRDLHNQDVYGQHMAEIMSAPDGSRQPMPKVIAGWLQRGEGSERVATITPCHFAKIEYRRLMSYAKERQVPGFSPGNRQSSVSKYRAWGKASLDVMVEVEKLRPVQGVSLPYGFGRVVGPGSTAATLVFTGQPSSWRPDQPPRRGGGQAKHHDFVFYGSGTPVPVSSDIFKGFEFVHSDRGQQNARGREFLPNEEWEYWKSNYDEGKKVPVFFLAHPNGELRAFGLAMMFRLPYDHSVKDGVLNCQPALKKTDGILDFAQTLFGHVPPGIDETSESDTFKGRLLKGRVSFGLARAEGNPKPVALVDVVLGSPKASYYPAYIEQGPAAPGAEPAALNNKPKWKTWMDSDVRVRGWKRYRPQPGPVSPALPTRGDGRAMDVSRVASRLNPLPESTSFLLRLRLHNVRRAELGALLWALDFGKDNEARHTLGMARSLGYGRCRFEVAEMNLENVREIGVSNGDEARAEFESLMEKFADENHIPGGWKHSRELFELRALAHTLDESSPHRLHMRIDDPVVRNEFQSAKQAGRALPSAGTTERWAVEARAAGHAITLAGPPAEPGSATRDAGTQKQSVGAWREATQAPRSQSIKSGTRIEVELTGLSKKGKWQAKVLSPAAIGVVAFGVAPEDAAVGKKYTVVVTAGGDLGNVQMKWR